MIKPQNLNFYKTNEKELLLRWAPLVSRRESPIPRDSSSEHTIYLPSDMCQLIFQRLCVKDLLICEQVCFNFNLEIKNNPDLFHFKNPVKLYRNNILSCSCGIIKLIKILFEHEEIWIISRKFNISTFD
jgi:hypothetical protein